MALRDRLPFPIFGSDQGRNGNGTEGAGGSELLGHTAPAPEPEQMPEPRIGMAPIGQSGRANFWGLPAPDELNRELIGPEGLRRFNEMYRTDPHVRRLVLAAWSPLVAGTWTLEPYGGEDTTDQDKQIADTIWWMLSEFMSPNFAEHLYQLGPLLIRSGFTPFEQLWATVERDGRTLLAPRKLDVRLPKSVWRWWQDDFGELTHIGQVLPNRADIVIPASELVYYRLGAEGDNWQGTSLLRHAWKPWFLKDKLERIDAIGQERKAVGVPVCYPPTSATAQQKAQVEVLLANLHMSDVAYVMMPGPKAGSQGSAGVPQEEWLLDVIKFDSSAGEGIMNSISYHQTAIAASFLTDFLELGHHQVGARATAEVQEDPFLTAVNGALLPPVVPPLNRLIDRIRRLNWDSAEGSPTLKLTLHDEASLSEIAAYVVPLIQSGALQVDPELEDYLRDRGGLPHADQVVRDARAKAQQEGLDAAAKLATTGEGPGAEPPSPAADPAGPKPNPIVGAVRQTGQEPLGGDAPPRTLEAAAGPVAGGLIVQAADTGRVLLVQRTPDDGDPADVFASWEFPGGKLDDSDPSAWQGAAREWGEETGAALPPGAVRLGDFSSPDGNYRAFVVRIPSETDVTLGTYDKGEVARCAWQDPQSLEHGTFSDRAQLLVPGLERALAGSPRTLDAPEPTAKWFERLLSEQRLREAFDGARDHIEQACSPQALTLARQLAYQAGNATPMTASAPPPELVDALSGHYEDMYRLGHETVLDELARQRAVLPKTLEDPSAPLAAGAGSRFARARARGEHSARNILQRIQERLGRDQITGLKSPTDLQSGAEQAALQQLRSEALANTAAMVNDGRYDAAAMSSDVVGGYYTSVMDDRSCDPCITADTGELLSIGDAIALGPPNPLCEGQDRCRCAIVWVLSSDPAALQAVI